MEVYNEKELYNSIKDAYLSGKKVMIIGYGKHSSPRKSDIYLKIKMDYYKIEKEGYVEAYAGASVNKIREEASEYGLLLPCLYDGSIGGLLANNEFSPLSTRYGKPYDFTDKVFFITPFGKISWKIIIGSKGRLGAIYKARLKLFPKPTKVFTFERSFSKKDETIAYVNKLMHLKPLAMLVEYDGKYTIHASYDFDAKIHGFSKDEGVATIEESNSSNGYYVNTPTIEDFMSTIENTQPIYAYTVVGSGISKLYVADEDAIKKLNYFTHDDIPRVYWKLKAILDFKNIFA
ncbi:FAD-binding protein [Acidianus infernus]|uniref:FAD-binding protein n=1 Tax=Acidianus infernus TaxID=12915 RepID=UPI00359332FF